ncbi:IclR family transcriptional regulator [Achromobacter sp.]|uniref:IclR family transcriptional regulator n=1 Tax=Achromobacter sp. TaxID=134375 RepID=UPI002F9527BB
MLEQAELEVDDGMFNHSFARGLKVLFAFRGAQSAMSLSEVAQAVGTSVSTAQRTVYTLEKLGLISKSPKTRKFSPTLRVLELGYNYIAADPLVEAANPFLAELSNITGETVNLTEPLDHEMVYVSRVVAAKFIPIHMPIGSRIPMYCTASGRAYLGALPEEQAQAILDASALQRHTQWTETDPAKLMEIVRQARREGIAHNKEELFLGDMTIAAPIMGQRGTPVASVHIVAPTSRWTLEEALARLGPLVFDCARGINNSVRSFT